MKRIVLLFGSILFLSLSLSAQTQTVVATAHSGGINHVARDLSGTYLFSAGEDGVVRIWDTRKRRMTEYIRVSPMPVHMIAVNPVRSEFAVLEREVSRGFLLSVWDWEKKEKIFSFKINEMPLSLRFSPKGTYLVFSRTDWNSLTFLDASTGQRLPLLSDGFGIVSDFIISRSEQTILAYNPAGSIQYWDIRRGTLKQRVHTESNVKYVSFNNDNRYMSGFRDGNLLVIDLVSGKVHGRTPVEQVYATRFDSSTNNIITLSEDENRTLVKTFAFHGAGFNLSERYSTSVTGTIVNAVYSGTVYISLKNEGFIASLNPVSGRATSFTAARLAVLTDFAFLDDYAAISSSEKIFLFRSPYFKPHPLEEPRLRFTRVLIDNPFTGVSGIIRGSYNSFVVWEKGGEKQGLYGFLDPSTGTLSDINTMPFPITDIKSTGNRLLFMESNGRLTVKEAFSLDTIFSYTAFGIQSVVPAGDEKLIAGKTKINTTDSSMVEVNIRTRETVLIESGNLYTYDLVYDPVSNQVFSLGIEQLGTRLRTVLKAHSGTHYENSRTIIASDNEDVSASIVIDPETSRIYTSLGFSSIRQFKGYGISTLTRSEGIPRKLKIHNSYLYALNRDSSISVWDKLSGKKVMDFYILENDEWIVLLSDGTYTSSPGAQQFVSVGVSHPASQGDS